MCCYCTPCLPRHLSELVGSADLRAFGSSILFGVYLQLEEETMEDMHTISLVGTKR